MTGAADRSAFRAFVRDNHPDRGGDPEAFQAGLAAFGRQPVPAGSTGNLVFHRRRRGLAVVRGWWTDRRSSRRRTSRLT
ncbi:MAG: hypothetical protein M3Z02_05835 [Actinomycetota bacterium]|nr:hypothetical protein [Actinomycetota bacterium]